MPRHHLSQLLFAITLATTVGIGACSEPDITSAAAGGPGNDSPTALLTATDDSGQALTAPLTFSPGGSATIHVTNTGTAESLPLSISFVDFVGSTPADFAIDPATTCAQLALAVGGRCDVIMRYQPVSGAPMSGNPDITGLSVFDVDSAAIVFLQPI